MRTFSMLLSAWLASVAMAGPARSCGVAEPGPAHVREVAPGLFVRQGAQALTDRQNLGGIANIGFIVGRKAVAVVDTGGSLCDGASLRAAIAERTALPIRYVINTHVHPDHLLGNAAFEADHPEFVGHANLPRALTARGGHYLRTSREALGEPLFAGTKILPPTKTVASTLRLDLGGRTLLLTAHEAAHTDNDLTVLDESTGVLWTGDLLFMGHVPVLDGRLLGWLEGMKRLEASKAGRVVPGHGPAVAELPAALVPQRRYLQRLAKDLRAHIAQGSDIMEATPSTARSERSKWKLFDEFNPRNVTAGFAELEWE